MVLQCPSCNAMNNDGSVSCFSCSAKLHTASAPPSNYSVPPPTYEASSKLPPYEQQQGYPPQQGAHPPQQGAYPPQQGAYPPQQLAYPPQQQHYGSQQGGVQGGYAGGPPGRPPAKNPINLALSMWVFAFFTLSVFVLETYDKRDSRQKQHMSSMRVIPGMGLAATGLCFIVHMYSGYYQDRPWLKNESIFYGAAVAFFGYFLNIGVYIHCVNTIEDFGDLKTCIDNYKGGMVAVPVMALILTGIMSCIIRSRSRPYTPQTKRSIEGVWAFPKAGIRMVCFFILSCAISIIERWTVECYSDVSSLSDADDCATNKRLALLIVSIPIFILLSIYNSSFRQAEALSAWKMTSFTGRLEFLACSITSHGLCLYTFIVAAFTDCSDEDCTDTSNKLHLGLGLLMVFEAVGAVAMSFYFHRSSLESVPSQPNIQA